MLKKFDAVDFMLLILSFCRLVVLLEQSDWLDWFNSPTICVVAVYLIDPINHLRGDLHRERILDTIGHVRYRLVQAIPLPGQDPPALTRAGARWRAAR